MQIQKLYFDNKSGWNDNFPDMDSENTLILVFFAPMFFKNQKPINDVVKHYPNAQIIGCSGSGEIFDDTIYDENIVIAIVKFDKTKIKTYCTKILDEDSYKAGKQISQRRLTIGKG